MRNHYYAEFGTSWWERLKANISFKLLRTDYKIRAEINGRNLIGAFRFAELIALELFYSQLRLTSVDEKVEALKGLYFFEKNKHAPIEEIRRKDGRLEMLEALCKSYLFSKVKDGKIRLF